MLSNIRDCRPQLMDLLAKVMIAELSLAQAEISASCGASWAATNTSGSITVRAWLTPVVAKVTILLLVLAAAPVCAVSHIAILLALVADIDHTLRAHW